MGASLDAMTAPRAFILAMCIAFAIEAGIFYGLAALGANGELVVAVEMVWLCVAVLLTLLFVDRFESDEHHGKDSEPRIR
jgi:hypothetical protein